MGKHKKIKTFENNLDSWRCAGWFLQLFYGNALEYKVDYFFDDDIKLEVKGPGGRSGKSGAGE